MTSLQLNFTGEGLRLEGLKWCANILLLINPLIMKLIYVISLFHGYPWIYPWKSQKIHGISWKFPPSMETFNFFLVCKLDYTSTSTWSLIYIIFSYLPQAIWKIWPSQKISMEWYSFHGFFFFPWNFQNSMEMALSLNFLIATFILIFHRSKLNCRCFHRFICVCLLF